MSNIKNLSYLFENNDPFSRYSKEREEEELARRTFYVLQEMINDKDFVLQEGWVDAIKGAGKGAWEGAKKGWQTGKMSEKLLQLEDEFLQGDVGKKKFQDGQNEASFLKRLKKAFPGMKNIETIGKEWLNKKLTRTDGATPEKENAKDDTVIDTNKDGNEAQIKSGLSAMRKINVQDFVDAFKEARNDGTVTTVLNDSDFGKGMQIALSKYLDSKIESSSNNPAAQATYKKIQELFGKNRRLARPIGYAAAAMMNHMVGEIVGTEGAVDKMKERQDRLEGGEGYRAARKATAQAGGFKEQPKP